MIYLFIVLLMLFCIYIYDIRKSCRYKYTCFYGLFVLLIILNVMSYRIGGDMEVYSYRFEHEYKSFFEVDLANELTAGKEQPGWVLLRLFAKSVCDNIIFLKLILALFVNFSIAHFFRKHTTHIFSAVLLYFVVSYFNYNFEILRESISVSIFLLAFDFILKGKWVKYLASFLVAYLFHESSLVMLLIPVFFLFRNLTIGYMFGLLAIIYVIFLKIDLMGVLLAIVPDQASFYDKFYDYMNSSTYGENEVNLLMFTIASFVIPIISYFILKLYKRDNYFPIVILISVVFNLLTAKVFIFYRFNNYVLIPLSVAYVEVMHIVSQKLVVSRKKVLCIPLLTVYIIYKTYSIYFQTEGMANGRVYNRYYPYSSLIDKEIPSERIKFMNNIFKSQYR